MKMVMTEAMKKRLARRGGEVSIFEVLKEGQTSLDNWVDTPRA